MAKSVGFIGVTSHARDDVPKRPFKSQKDVREDVCCHAQVIRCLMKAVMTHVGLEYWQHRHQVLPLFRPGFQSVHRKGMAEIVDPRPVARVGDPRLPQGPPEVFVDIAQRHRLPSGYREKEGVWLWEKMDRIRIGAETFEHGC